MERPAIHRLNPQGNYTLKNCKYVEFKEHNRLACLLGNRWSIKYKRCVSCNSKRYKHIAHGYCSSCYKNVYLPNKFGECNANTTSD